MIKRVYLSLVAVFFLFNSSHAQYEQTLKVSGKAVIKTPTILCEKCQERTEFFISHTVGVTSVAVNIRKKTTTVSWLNDRTRIENIRAAIASLGYDADDIEADPLAFKKLPKACKEEILAAKAKLANLKAEQPEIKQ